MIQSLSFYTELLVAVRYTDLLVTVRCTDLIANVLIDIPFLSPGPDPERCQRTRGSWAFALCAVYTLSGIIGNSLQEVQSWRWDSWTYVWQHMGPRTVILLLHECYNQNLVLLIFFHYKLGNAFCSKDNNSYLCIGHNALVFGDWYHIAL